MNKTITLAALMLVTFGASAQQKLIGTNTVVYDETSAIQYIDSSVYAYNSFEGSLLSNEPQFIFEGSVIDWAYEFPAIKWDTEKSFTGTSLPLMFEDLWTNTFVGGNATVSESSSDKEEFTYDGAGNLTNNKTYFWDGSVFVLVEEWDYEYDANGNKTFDQYTFHGSGSPVVESYDSLFYDASDNLIRSISYDWDGTSAFYAGSESLITYSGSEITNLKLYAGDDVTPLEWIYDIYYTYVSGVVTGIDGYPVMAGVPDSVIEVEIDFTYAANGKLSTYEGYSDSLQFVQRDYEYDAQDFISKITKSDLDFGTSTMYISSVTDYYYQLTANLDEEVLSEANVFPNPSEDFITISTDSEIDQVTVYGLNGKVMLTQNNGNIDISNLPAGAYIAKVKTTTGVSQARFVKH